MPEDLKAPPHTPVLLDEVLAALQPELGKTYVDATLGAGGHACAILKYTEGAQLLGIDQDPTALQLATKKLAGLSGFQSVQGNFSDIASLLPDAFRPITGGILADIGVSSMQLDQGERGFSFRQEAPLDMRMAPDGELTAADVVNTYPEAELVRIFSEYGEEHMSKTVAREIVARRRTQPFRTTTDLAELMMDLYKSKGKREPIHPATRVFQALRIEVNDELGSLQRFLDSLPALLAPSAHIVIISFHSLEDRIVKDFFKQESKNCICPPRLPICQCGHQASLKILTKNPVQAGPEEIKKNPRSRSAKLRAAIRI